ncbi:hypothetical protein S245_027178 [Arachis hypogaea]
MKIFYSKKNQFEEKWKKRGLKILQSEPSKKSLREENVQDNQLSRGSDARSFELFSNDEQTDFHNNILVYLQCQSDPAELIWK